MLYTEGSPFLKFSNIKYKKTVNYVTFYKNYVTNQGRKQPTFVP
jgi:hypothetical protein